MQLEEGNAASLWPVTIRAVDNTKTMQINQRKQPPIDGLFISFGTFQLDEQSTILITNADTDGYMVVDALQLVAVD